MPEHSVITDPNIHEPKGIASATSGQVYVANGSGSGSWSTPATVPSQTGHSGKTLTTDGSTTSWTANNRVLARGSVDVGSSTVSNGVNVASVSGSTSVTVTFTTPLSSTAYVVLATITGFLTTTDQIIMCNTKGTTSVTFRTYRGANGAAAQVSSFDFVILG